MGSEELGLDGRAWARLADRKQSYGQPFPLQRGGVLQELDWACGQVGWGESVHACVFVNSMWTQRVAVWVGLGGGVCTLVCL